MRRAFFWVSWASALLSCGADNAVLELTVTYPAKPDWYPEADPLYVRAQAQRAGFGQIDLRWMGVDLSRPVSLDARPTDPQLLSIVAEGEIERPDDLVVKFLFCKTQTCEADSRISEPIVAEVWYRIGTPFYRGKETSFLIEIPGVPRCRSCTAPMECQVDACEADRCSCQQVGTTDMLCYYEDGLRRSCVAEEPPATTDKSTCEVALSMEVEPVWLCNIDKCDVMGCLMGSPTMYCNNPTERIHECER